MDCLCEKDEANPLETRGAVQGGPAQISCTLKSPTSSLVLVDGCEESPCLVQYTGTALFGLPVNGR